MKKKPNPNNMTKAEILERFNYRCSHHHDGFSHPQCYDRDKGNKERIGHLDIEASNLNANFGIVLSYCIKEDEGKIIKRLIEPKHMKDGSFDKHLMIQFCKDVRKFDRLTTWYGGGFDIPFLRTRCVFHGLDFPLHGEVAHTDVWFIARKKFRFHSNRMEVVAKFFNIAAKNHPLVPEIWLKCMTGDRKALKFVLTHNVEDVETLEQIYHKIIEYKRFTRTSI